MRVSRTPQHVAVGLKQGNGTGLMGHFVLQGTGKYFIVTNYMGSVEYQEEVGADFFSEPHGA